MREPTDADWANAIASRISDEWRGKSDFPEDAELLRNVLAQALTAHPHSMAKLIGTGIIEEDYFEPLA
jgi:hypothetical protein